MNHNAKKQYLRDEILGASPQKLILLLYDGAIRNVEEAKRRIEDENPYDFTVAVTKAEAIVAELMGALKKEKNAQITINMVRLYEYLYKRLVEAHQSKDPAIFQEVSEHLSGLRETWSEAIEKAEEAPAPQDAPPVAISNERPSLSFEA